MKKNLLLAIAAGVVLNASAQNQRALNSNLQQFAKLPNRSEVNKNDAAKASIAPIKTKKNKLNTVARTASSQDIVLGSGPNAYSITGGPRTYLWADPSLNTVTFSHRAKLTPATNTGTYVYDLSKDGGATWTVNKGPVYIPASNNPGNPNASIGRYPQGFIYNPVGNTVADSAYFSYFGPTLDNSNGIIQGVNGAFGGLASGVVQLDGTGRTQTQTRSNKVGTERQFRGIPEGSFITQQGVAWGINFNTPLIGQTNIYNDSLSIYKGVFNGVDMVYTHQFLQVPLSTEGSDAGSVAASIGFAPDGQKGWIALIGHDKNITTDEDSVWYPILYKTVDGGATWTGPTKVCVGRLNEVVNKLGSFNDADSYYTTAFEIDLAVDFYGNPHINVSIGVGAVQKIKPAGAPSTWSPSPSWSFPSQFSNWAQFAVYSLDQGANFQAELLHMPGEFRGCYGDCPSGTDRLQEDLRGQVSTSWDGKKVFYTWFETDTISFGTADGNKFPDMWVKGVDVGTTNATWGRAVNLTPSGAEGNGAMMFGCVSYYVLENTPSVYEIPAVYQLLSNGEIATQVEYHYIKGATYEFDTTYVVALDAQMRSQCIVENPLGIKQVTNVTSSAVAVYPNPTNGIANINYTLAKNASVTIELYSILGTQVAVLASNENQSAGAHTLTFDMSKLNTGVYFLRSTINGESKVTKISKN